MGCNNDLSRTHTCTWAHSCTSTGTGTRSLSHARTALNLCTLALALTIACSLSHSCMHVHSTHTHTYFCTCTCTTPAPPPWPPQVRARVACSRSFNPHRRVRNAEERNGGGVDRGRAVEGREPCERKQSLLEHAKVSHLTGQTKSFLGTFGRMNAASWRQRRKPIGCGQSQILFRARVWGPALRPA
jgi:hypothetical protein